MYILCSQMSRLCFTCLALLVGAGQVEAGFVVATFSGTVSGQFGVGSPVTAGQQFDVSYIFDTLTPDTSPYPQIEGQYRQAAGSGITVVVGSSTFFSSGNGFYGSSGYIIRVQNDAGPGDTYSVQAGPQGGAPDGQLDISIGFSDSSSTALSSNALPSSFALASWSSGSISVASTEGWAFGGQIESVRFAEVAPVPTPSSLTLALIGGVFALCLRRSGYWLPRRCPSM